MSIPTLAINEICSMPMIGLGTWNMHGETCSNSVSLALDIGYRHIDTAHLYENHKAIGKSIKHFRRNELYIVSKFMISQLKHETTEGSCIRALDELGIDYLDLYLLHYPDREADMETIFHEMLDLVQSGKCRAVGVSNFTKRHLQDMLDLGIFMPVNQVEFHPYLNQKELQMFATSHHILLESYRPLGKGALVKDPIFEKIGRRYGKSPAQICLKWIIEKKMPVVPKASSRQHLIENFSIFDFSLDPDDFKILDNLNLQHRFCDTPGWGDFNYI